MTAQAALKAAVRDIAGALAGVDGWWQVRSDKEARVAAAGIVVQLAGHGWPVITPIDRR
jgi:predicted acyltransferase